MMNLMEIAEKLQSVIAEHGDIEFAVDVEVEGDSDVAEGDRLTAYGSFFRRIEIQEDPSGKDGKYCVLVVSEGMEPRRTGDAGF